MSTQMNMTCKIATPAAVSVRFCSGPIFCKTAGAYRSKYNLPRFEMWAARSTKAAAIGDSMFFMFKRKEMNPFVMRRCWQAAEIRHRHEGSDIPRENSLPSFEGVASQ